MDKIFKYIEYLKENLGDTPEQYVDNALVKLKTKLEKMFALDKVEGDEIKKYGELKSKSEMEEGKMSFKDLGLELQSCELSKYSKVYDNIKLKFSDPEALYDVTFTIDLKDAVQKPEDKEKDKDFSDKEIKNCFVKFKKYDTTKNFELIGQITKTVKIDEIDEEMLMNLKIELDDEYGSGKEEFELETEE